MTIVEQPVAPQPPVRLPIPGDSELAEPLLGDIKKWESITQQYLDGHIEDDVYKTYRLTNGVYGQRQGGRNQMVRIKVPYGSIRPEQLEMVGYLAEHYSRGWAHITTRQNLQMHYVQLDQISEVLRLLASVGLTTREACGDTVRNIGGCHLAGACPYEILDISPWAEAAYEHFVRNPIAQRLPRKFKINFSGCDTDCGQAMFNGRRRRGGRRPRRARQAARRLSGVRGRRPRRQSPRRAGFGGLHPTRRAAADNRVDPAGVRPGGQPPTTGCAPA